MKPTNAEIVGDLARGHVVEQMAENIAHASMSADLEDLCQMVYVALLEYDNGKLADLWEHGEIRFFLARIIMNQFRSGTSPFHALIRRFRERADGLEAGASIADK